MMRRFMHIVPALLLVLGLSAPLSAQTQTGIVEGKVFDQQNAVLPGATVTATGPRGTVTTVTDAEGIFRFVGLQPATYTVKTELSGFVAQELQAEVGMGRTVTVDFSLKLTSLSENVEVRASASAVDVRSSSTETTVSSDLLTLMPIYSATSTGLLNNAPGINSSSAYGAQGSYGNALLMDGVDTRDPEGGSAWTFFNQNLIQEIQIGGLGAPAEYGGFTGAIINTVTKSGTNAFSGLFSLRYTNDSLAGDNISQEFLTANPTLGDAATVTKLVDYTVQVGGPLKRDKAFFFGSVQRYSQNQNPAGPVTKQTDISPRFNMKFTLQPTATDTLILGTQYDAYNVTGRVGYWPASQAGDNQTVTEDAPEWVWNAQYRKIFGSDNLLEAKFTGYWGYYYLDPVDPSIFTFDGESGEYSGGGGGHLLRGPHQESAPGVVHEVREQVRPPLPEVRRRDRAQPRPQPVSAVRAGGRLHLRLRRRAVLRRQLWLRRPGRQPANVGLRPGSVAGRPHDAQHRPAARSSERLQPSARRDGLQTQHVLGTPCGHGLRPDGQRHERDQGVLGSLFRGRGERVLHAGDAGRAGLLAPGDSAERRFRAARSRHSRRLSMASATTSIIRARMNSTCRSKRS